MRIEEINVAEHWEDVRELVPVLLVEDSCGLIAYKDDEPVAAMVVDNRTFTSAAVHLGWTSPLAARGFLVHCVDYLFRCLQLKHVWTQIPSTRIRAIRLALKLGFKHMGHIPQGYSDTSDLLFFKYEVE